MGSRIGCEYRYSFSAEDEIISKYGSWYEEFGMRYVFEIRTNFIVKGKFDDGVAERVIGSEMFDVGVFEFEEERNEENMSLWVGTRLKDYWMSDDEIREFVRIALAFADDQNVEPGMMIPIGVDIGVCSVQQEGEPINATVDRAIKPECLYPLFLCPWIQGSHPTRLDNDHPDIHLMQVLRHYLPTTRVEQDDDEECVICLSRPTIGSQITSLQCGHDFHYHCIAKWLADNDSCPSCRRQAHDAFDMRKRHYQRS